MITWEFPKIRGTLFWGPSSKDPTISGSMLGSPIFGNSHMHNWKNMKKPFHTQAQGPAVWGYPCEGGREGWGARRGGVYRGGTSLSFRVMLDRYLEPCNGAQFYIRPR